jgi:hypothetical protein
MSNGPQIAHTRRTNKNAKGSSFFLYDFIKSCLFVYKGKEVLIAKNVLVWVLLHSSDEPNTQRAMKILYLFENCFLYGFEKFPFS